MSRYGDVIEILPRMLKKYNRNRHTAIVETYSEMLEDCWDTQDIKNFLLAGVGISYCADVAIKEAALSWGISLEIVDEV